MAGYAADGFSAISLLLAALGATTAWAAGGAPERMGGLQRELAAAGRSPQQQAWSIARCGAGAGVSASLRALWLVVLHSIAAAIGLVAGSTEPGFFFIAAMNAAVIAPFVGLSGALAAPSLIAVGAGGGFAMGCACGLRFATKVAVAPANHAALVSTVCGGGLIAGRPEAAWRAPVVRALAWSPLLTAVLSALLAPTLRGRVEHVQVHVDTTRPHVDPTLGRDELMFRRRQSKFSEAPCEDAEGR